MKLLAVYSSNHILGGGEISFTLALTALQRAGVEVLAAVPASGPLSDYLSRSDIRVTVVPQQTLRPGFGVRYLVRPHPKWIALVRQFRPDIIHCNAIRPALYAQAAG